MEEQKKIYRPNVAAIIVSPKYPEKCEIFIAKRSDVQYAWQFPQGGIDEGETPKQALFRELKEEIGTNRIEIVAKYPYWITYDFPPRIAERMAPYHGQRQKYYLVRLKRGSKIDLEAGTPEFNQYKFVSVGSVIDQVSYFKKPIYTEVINYFKKEGYLLC